MGELVDIGAKGERRVRGAPSSPPGNGATILFFTGVRYERPAAAPDPTDPPRLGAPGGASRGRRRRAS